MARLGLRAMSARLGPARWSDGRGAPQLRHKLIDKALRALYARLPPANLRCVVQGRPGGGRPRNELWRDNLQEMRRTTPRAE